MIAVDTNILVYSHRREVAEHQAAFAKMHELSGAQQSWAIPWPCLYEFFSVVTNRRIWKDVASTPEEAWGQIRAWIAAPSLVLLAETDDFAYILEDFLKRPRVCGPVVHDARVAAICVAHGVSALLSRDRDFALFPELRIENPFS